MSVAFDTLKLAQALRDRGRMPAEQAEGIAGALADATEDRLVTKADLTQATDGLQGEHQKVWTELKGELQEVRTELKSEIQEVRTELKAEIYGLRVELTGEIRQSELRMKAESEKLRADVAKWVFGQSVFVALLFTLLRFAKF